MTRPSQLLDVLAAIASKEKLLHYQQPRAVHVTMLTDVVDTLYVIGDPEIFWGQLMGYTLHNGKIPMHVDTHDMHGNRNVYSVLTIRQRQRHHNYVYVNDNHDMGCSSEG